MGIKQALPFGCLSHQLWIISSLLFFVIVFLISAWKAHGKYQQVKQKLKCSLQCALNLCGLRLERLTDWELLFVWILNYGKACHSLFTALCVDKRFQFPTGKKVLRPEENGKMFTDLSRSSMVLLSHFSCWPLINYFINQGTLSNFFLCTNFIIKQLWIYASLGK